MGMYGGGGDPAAAAAAQQAQQQAAIKQGQGDIEATFSGYKGVTPILGQPTAGKPYYDQYGAVVTDPSAYAPGTAFYADRVKSGGFDDAFYAQRQQDYMNYALPRLQQQFQNQTAQSKYALARSGLQNSTGADTISRALNLERVNQTQDLSNTAIGQAQQLRSNVENQKNTLLNQLQLSADPAQAAQGSLAAVSQFSTPSAFPALGALFSNFANTYLTKNLAQTYGQVGQPGYVPSSFGGGSPTVGSPLGNSSYIH